MSLTAGQPGQLSLCSVLSTRSAPITQALLPFSSHGNLYNSTKNNSLYWIEAWGFHTLTPGYLIIKKSIYNAPVPVLKTSSKFSTALHIRLIIRS